MRHNPRPHRPRRWLRVLGGNSLAICAFCRCWDGVEVSPVRMQAVACAGACTFARECFESRSSGDLTAETGKPWTNTLDMRFVPVGDIHMAVFETRVRDFEAFVQATHYDAEGGMSSVMKQDGFRAPQSELEVPRLSSDAG